MKSVLDNCSGFEWDEWNADKIRIRHGVSKGECEELFFNRPLIVKTDAAHSLQEDRYFTLERTDTNRFLFTVFTIKETLIRVISARDMTKRERRVYEEKIKRDSRI